MHTYIIYTLDLVAHTHKIIKKLGRYQISIVGGYVSIESTSIV